MRSICLLTQFRFRFRPNLVNSGSGQISIPDPVKFQFRSIYGQFLYCSVEFSPSDFANSLYDSSLEVNSCTASLSFIARISSIPWHTEHCLFEGVKGAGLVFNLHDLTGLNFDGVKCKAFFDV